jgi:hypothetical protein
MNQYDALKYIRENLNSKPLTYQLGFLQGFLAKQMSQRMEIASEFRDQIKSTQKK